MRFKSHSFTGLCLLRHLFATVLCAGSVFAAGLNDTGITNFANDSQNGLSTEPGTHPRQDASQGRDAAARDGTLFKVGGGGAGFDFTKIANDGSVLSASATLGTGSKSWACTRDNVTGLIWEVKTTSGLHSQSHTYTWYNSDSSTNGGNPGTSSGGSCHASGRCDTEKFVADVNAARLCGASDWRMPSIKELSDIADLGRSSPAIDPTYFPNMASTFTWSASPVSFDTSMAWYVSFSSGKAYVFNRNNPSAVLLVRKGQ